MAPATYISVIGLGVLYTFIWWMFVAGWGSRTSAPAVTEQFAGKIALGLLSADRPVFRLDR